MKRIQRSRNNIDNIVLTAEEEVRKDRCDNYLYDFSKAMKAKLEVRATKHPKDDVTKNTCDWDFKRSDLEDHLKQEVLEYIKSGDPKELVDIGNMAFILWATIKFGVAIK